jgi:HD-GYP domain-containing protein (c-di-GMP phosphodiesterase class II)
MSASPVPAPVNAAAASTHRSRYPLQFGIAVAFTLLIVLFGSALIGFNYQESKAMALISAQDIFTRITRQVTTNIRELYAPAEAIVDLTVQLPAAEGSATGDRAALLKYFAEALRESTTISSLYVGYTTGEFFQVNALRDYADTRAALEAPTAAAFAVVSIVQQGKARQRRVDYYDANLNRIGSRVSPTVDYDPRTRPWYQAAIGTDKQIGSGFYLFHTPRVLGTTAARRTPHGKSVVGADLTLRDLSQGIGEQRVTVSTEILVFNAQGSVISYAGQSQSAHASRSSAQSSARLPKVRELGDPLFEKLHDEFVAGSRTGEVVLSVAGRDWFGSISPLPLRSGNQAYLAVLVPQDELLAGVRTLRDRSVVISLVLLLVAILAGWWFARRIAVSLRTLAEEAQQIRQLKFDTPITVRSRFIEVDDLALTLAMTKSAVQDFVEISKALSAEPDFDRLLERILAHVRTACHADGGGIALVSDDGQQFAFALIVNPRIALHQGGTSGNPISAAPVVLPEMASATLRSSPAEFAIRTGHTLIVDDIAADAHYDWAPLQQRYAHTDYRCQSFLIMPLRNRKNEIIGVLELVNARGDDADALTGFRPEVVSYAEALSSQAAIALDNRRLLKAQKDLLDAFIQLIAGAIDAKSPYTSGHCQRVPELARLLAHAAHDSEAAAFRDFHLSDEEWYELHIASWLHDCGKVTTPEYVVDKATKLECLYNRIHEVRMRFEVLWRDAQIEQYQALLSGSIDEATLQRQLDARLTQLREDFAFVAECNVGGEFMADERIARLLAIGSQPWKRYFDDRIGLSHEEQLRKEKTAAPALPAVETLLANKVEHIIERDAGRSPFGDNIHGFDMEVPAHAFNHGELHNLSIRRGTLTDEERFKINEHITQTIMLLGKLPFPRELRRVPRWAGTHHEKLDGSGYPRRLHAEQLSIPDRIMAIADIFEALTASDRPYKKAKTLSETLRIMSFMRNDNHICPDLFALFLTSGTYLDYARRFLTPDQIDAVDVSAYLARKTAG